MVPNKSEGSVLKKDEKTLTSIPLKKVEFINTIKETKTTLTLVVKGEEQEEKAIPMEVHELLDEFEDVIVKLLDEEQASRSHS